MSTETLRRAAETLRWEWGTPMGGAWHRVRDFHLGVADWLDREAALHEALADVGGLLQTAAKDLGAGELRIQFSETADGMAASTMPQALAVARVVLGERS